jgi:hypothetical protein
MTDLDTRVRTGLAASAERITAPDTDGLVARLGAPRRGSGRGRSRMPWLAAAAVLVVVLAVAIVVASGGDDDGEVATDPAPSTADAAPTGLGSTVAPGWHPLDTGPVAADDGTALVWTGTELVVLSSFGAGWARAGDGTWREIAPVPVPRPAPAQYGITATWTGTEVVVAVADVGSTTSAAWDPTTGTWRDLGSIPLAPVIAEYGFSSVALWPTNLIWTGERVVDPARLAVLDPVSGGWTTMPLPAEVDGSPHLMSGEMVWDGEELVWIGWMGDGLAWDADVTAFRTVPAAPVEVAGEPAVVPSSRTVVADGEIVVVAGIAGRSSDEPGGAMALDAGTGTWRRLPEVPGVSNQTGCPLGVDVVAGRPVVQRCDDGGVVTLVDGAWVDTGAVDVDPGAHWLSTGDGLVVWSSDTDTVNDREAPYVRAWTWVPPG